jgi:hypothetical protein
MNAPAMRIAFNGVREATEVSGHRPDHIRHALANSGVAKPAIVPP